MDGKQEAGPNLRMLSIVQAPWIEGSGYTVSRKHMHVNPVYEEQQETYSCHEIMVLRFGKSAM
jgi:hypothetical protein